MLSCTYRNQIYVSMLPSGVYLVRLKDKNKSIYHSRFIKE
ncbi:MAG: T9SS type A sorting domain-containing protein [Bacteroidia bacterium]|nr:T9SS type A sorting domain-containing protein [Bacteroidia bacterium]